MKDPQRVKVESDQDIIRVVRGAIADGDPRILERDGETVAVVLSPEDYAQISGDERDDIWAGYDPIKLRAAFDNASHYRNQDTDQLIRDIYNARGQGSPDPEAD